MKTRKKPTEHRQGQMVRLIDAIQEIIKLCYSEDIIRKTDSKEPDYLDVTYNPYQIDKIRKIAAEIREFDITNIGKLYLTSGGRIVLDKGYGEYFNKSDTPLFTKEQLTSGIKAEKFMQTIQEAIKKRKEEK